MIEILPADRLFTDSPDAGDPGCLCSRCLLLIGEDEVPIRAFMEDGGGEYRYHPACVGAVGVTDDYTEEEMIRCN